MVLIQTLVYQLILQKKSIYSLKHERNTGDNKCQKRKVNVVWSMERLQNFHSERWY